MRGALPIVAPSGRPAEGGDVEVAAAGSRGRVAVALAEDIAGQRRPHGPAARSAAPPVPPSPPVKSKLSVVDVLAPAQSPLTSAVSPESCQPSSRPAAEAVVPHPAAVRHVPGVVDDQIVELCRRRPDSSFQASCGRSALKQTCRQLIVLPKRVGDRELQAVDIAAVELHLQRVVVRLAEVRAHRDVLITEVGPQELGRLRRRRGARIGVLGIHVQEPGAVRHRG